MWHNVRGKNGYIHWTPERYIEKKEFKTWGERLFYPPVLIGEQTEPKKATSYRLVGFYKPAQASKPGKQGSGRSGRQKSIKERLKRISQKSPEVMVKITGGDFSSKMMKKHVDYISRNGQVPLNTEDEEIIKGRIDKTEIEDRWGHELTEEGKNEYKENYHVVFSMPPETPREEFRAATIETIGKLFKGHQYYWAEHQDTDHPHIHVVVKAKDINGKRLKTKKADLHRWREQYAKTLREHGLTAEATKRAQRGKILKPDKTQLYQLRRRGEMPEVSKKQKAEQQNRAKQGEKYQDTPAIKKARRTRYAVVHIYKNIITELNQSNDAEDKKLAKELGQYLKDMKAQTPEQQQYYNKAKAELDKANRLQKDLERQQRITIKRGKDKDKEK